VVAVVGVGQRRDLPVRAVDMTCELARALESRLVLVAEVVAEPARVLERAEQRPEHEHVVVRRRLAVNAVGVEIGRSVFAQRVEREVGEAAVGIELRNAERSDEQPVELERAVVAARGEPAAHVVDLVCDAIETR
jgi:hypothetical protein